MDRSTKVARFPWLYGELLCQHLAAEGNLRGESPVAVRAADGSCACPRLAGRTLQVGASRFRQVDASESNALETRREAVANSQQPNRDGTLAMDNSVRVLANSASTDGAKALNQVQRTMTGAFVSMRNQLRPSFKASPHVVV